MVLGIIAEYNPFTNGHLYHLNESKKKAGCEYTVAVISGNFTQRGSTSIVNKWEKAKMAISSGIDLVIELPTIYATSSAENFAEGAIKILDSLGIIDFLSFGAETDKMDNLKDIAEILSNEPLKYKSILSEELKKGISFPKARENAILSYFNNGEKYEEILSSPNNILAIEYLKALKKYNSKITPISIKRFMAEHNSMIINSEVSNIANSTAIRELIRNNDFEKIDKLVPESSLKIIEENLKKGHIVHGLNNFQKEIFYRLQIMQADEIAEISDVNEGLEFLIKNSLNKSKNFEELVDSLKSKRYTYTRIQRIVLHILLGITKQNVEMSKNAIPFVRVLGFGLNGKKLISKIKEKNPGLEIITSVKQFEKNNKNANLKSMLKKDILATNIYTLGYKNEFQNNLDYKMPLISNVKFIQNKNKI